MFKKLFLNIVVMCLLFSIHTLAQLSDIELYSTYSSALTKLNDIEKAIAVGGGLRVKYAVSENLSFGIEGGYKLFSVSQAGQLEKFGWQFWNDRYSNTIESNLNAKELNLSINITSTQKVDVIPVLFSSYYNIDVSDGIVITPSLAGGVYFYTRRMYVVENWSKYFPEEDYTFEYSYRNFAPSKRGNPIVGKAALDLSCNIADGFNLFAGGAFIYVIPTEGKLGYDNFIHENEFELKLGLTFIY